MEIQLSPIEITQLVNQIILISGSVGALDTRCPPLEDLCTNYNHNCHFVIGLNRGTRPTDRPTLLEFEMASPGCPDRKNPYGLCLSPMSFCVYIHQHPLHQVLNFLFFFSPQFFSHIRVKCDRPAARKVSRTIWSGVKWQAQARA